MKQVLFPMGGATTITGRKARSLFEDPVKCAEAINLVYITDKEAGISRVKKGNGFAYLMDSKEITDGETLDRIKKLVIPPAWHEVWICALPNGHLQATGVDTKNRKQYRYHPMWSSLRAQTKFVHLSDFATALPGIRKQIKADLALGGLPVRKVLATVVALMDETGIRIGGSAYEKMYGSFGLTTMKDKHVKINGSETIFSFKGKKGVYHNISLKNKKLSKIVRQCKDIPGKELFQYLDEDGQRKHIDSGMVNDYIREISGSHFTSKDFRTWVGTSCAVELFKSAPNCDKEADIKRTVVEVIDSVAKRLGNTRTVCRKYYVHPAVIDHYSHGTIGKFFDAVVCDDNGLSAEENALIKILGKCNEITALVA